MESKRPKTPEEKAESAALKAIFDGKKKELRLNQETFGEALGMSQAGVSHYLNGMNALNLPVAIKAAAILGVSIEDFSPRLAAQHRGFVENTFIARDYGVKGELPHISWVAAGELSEAENPYPAGHAKEWIKTPFDIDDGDYILTVIGQSMYKPDGTGYSDGDYIHVKANLQPTHGEDVIARTPDGKATFKRYTESESGAYLEAINEDWPERIIKIPEGTVFCGVVEGSWRKRRKNK